MMKAMMPEWREPAAVDVPADLRSAVGGHPLISEYLARKGITTPAAARKFMSPAHYTPAAANELPDIDRAAERLKRALRRKEKILIWGDFDVDGQTSTALLFSALKKRGANVSYYVPHRIKDGHGINLPTLKAKLAADVDLLLTCDTGISAHDAVEYAARRGVDVVITDHHALPETLPAAYAIVNPRRLPEEKHPLYNLPGVGVAYKLIEALYAGESTDFLLDLVALGIVADVVVQGADTRYLLQRGLERLRGNHRLGLRALLEQAKIQPQQLNEGHIGFALAPRLNALGRLDDANPAVELLTTNDWGRARIIANDLEGLNNRRKFLSNQVYQAAAAQIEGDPSLLEYAALVLSHEDWHRGVIGIVAGRLAEEYARPVVMISTTDDIGYGSARSVAGLDINAAFESELVVQHLTRYGGHSMAAGLTLPTENIFSFRRALSRVLRQMGAGQNQPTLQIDGYLALSDISLELAADIERLAPFGSGNPPLVFASRDLEAVSSAGLGRRGEHLQLHLEDPQGNRQRVIWWRGTRQDLPSGRFDLAYTLRRSSFKGQSEALVEWLGYRQQQSPAPEITAAEPVYEVIDHRQSQQPQEDFAAALTRYPNALVWAEVEKIPNAVNRLGLVDSETLIVYTVPPASAIWSGALATVNPARLILFGLRPNTETGSAFIKRLAGLIKYVINRRAGIIKLEDLAAAMGHRERTVRVGLQWLQAQGKIDYHESAGEYHIERSQRPPSAELAKWRERLDALLRETHAYRSYWMKMPLSSS